MSELLRSDFTDIAREAKNSLDDFFRIPLKEDVLSITEEMKRRNTKMNASSLGDPDERLLSILAGDANYLSENHKVLHDGKIVARSLFEKADDNEKRDFRDLERNARIIRQYENYAYNLKSIKELDNEFLAKLNTVYTQYKSSTDYMERLVNRLLKYNFGYPDEYVKGVETRVLILRRLINAYGYNCVSEISTPELEAIVKNEFDGDVEKITDDIFRYLNGSKENTVYDKAYIDALVELQATVIYKSSTIRMTKELCEELCSLICENAAFSVKNKKTVTEEVSKKVLTDSAIDGTARLLKDCFYEPSAFVIQYIKEYRNAEIDKIRSFTGKLTALYKKGKKEERSSFSDIDESIRLSTLFDEFSGKIYASERIAALFSIAFPKMIPEKGRKLSDCLSEENLKTIKCVKQSNIVKNCNKLASVRELLEECEKELSREDKKQYLALLYKKIGDRFNGATNSSKKDSLYKRANAIFDTGRPEYKMLKLADDLANAKFSPYGKTREYLYIFAIAFGMTSTGYAEDSLMADESTNGYALKEDPRKITDIQKNLFLDYYSDNIVNRLSSTVGFSEKKPNVSVDGYGINYKNFAEVTFLWCMRQKTETPKEKLVLAYEIIEHCKKKGKTEEAFKAIVSNSGEELTTQKYKGYYDTLGINITKKSDFQDYLIEKYPCRSNGNIMQVNGSGVSAGKELEKQQQRVEKLLHRVEDTIFSNRDSKDILHRISVMDNADHDIARIFILRHYLRELKCVKCKRRRGGRFPDCYAFFEPYSWVDKNGKEHLNTTCEDFCADKKYDDKETLRKSLKSIIYIGDDYEGNFERRLTTLSSLCDNKYSDLKNILEQIEKRVNINALYSEKEDVSRTALIALCYFEMVLMNYLYRQFGERNNIIETKTFEEFYKMFCSGRSLSIIDYDDETGEDNKEFKFHYPGADEILKKAGYQQINPKNMLDIYVIFLAFKDNYKKIFKLPHAEQLIRYAKKINKKLKAMEGSWT